MNQPSTDQPSTDPALLTADEVAVINAARAVCRAYSDRLGAIRWNDIERARPLDQFNVGRVNLAAEHADDLLFDLLNCADSYLHLDLTREQLHNPASYLPQGRVIPGDLRLVPVA